MSYTIRTLVRLVASFVDEDGDPADPTTVTFRTKAPDGTFANYVFPDDAAVTNPAVGTFRVHITPDQSGEWCYHAEGEGAVQVTTPDGHFEVDESCFE